MKKNLVYLPRPKHRIRAIKYLIDIAEEVLVMQMYLFAASPELQTLQPIPGIYPYARLVAGWLIDKKKNNPDIKIIIVLDTQTIADPKRTHSKDRHLTRNKLEEAGIIVLNAGLQFTNYKKGKSLLSIIEFHTNWENPKKIFPKLEWANLQNKWQTLKNVEDHRKNVVIDYGKAALLFSHNLMDMCYNWEENSFLLRKNLAEQVWKEAIISVQNALDLPIAFEPLEKNLKDWLGQQLRKLELQDGNFKDETTYILRSGPEIKQKIIELIYNTKENEIEEIYIASAYFSDMEILKLLQGSSVKKIYILIDSCEALPLPPLLKLILVNTVNLTCVEFCRRSLLTLKIFRSNYSRMMHCKSILFVGKKSSLLSGQANFTPNSFNGAWLETSLYTEDTKIIKQFHTHFESIWNQSELVSKYAEIHFWKRVRMKVKAFFFLFIIKIFSLIGLRY